MNTAEIETNRELQQVLWACYDCWQAQSRPASERDLCYTWVARRHEKRFRRRFHQGKLKRLARLGFLEPLDTSRGGRRRYYRLANPEKARASLAKWELLRAETSGPDP